MGWIVVAVVVGLLAWAVAAYNALVQRRNRIRNAWGQIDVQLKRRHDLVPNLVETARAYLKHEAGTLEAVTRARAAAVTAAQAARSAPTAVGVVAGVGQAEQALAEPLGRLLALGEAYPELKADQTMAALQEELVSTENRIGFARQAYNDEVLAYNDAATQFPQLLVARAFGFDEAAMLQSTQSAEERQPPRVAF